MKKYMVILLGVLLMLAALVGCGDNKPSMSDDASLQTYDDYIRAGYTAYPISEVQLEVLYKLTEEDALVYIDAAVYSTEKQTFVITRQSFTHDKTGLQESYPFYAGPDVAIELNYINGDGPRSGFSVYYQVFKGETYGDYIDEGYLEAPVDGGNYTVFYKVEWHEDEGDITAVVYDTVEARAVVKHYNDKVLFKQDKCAWIPLEDGMYVKVFYVNEVSGFKGMLVEHEHDMQLKSDGLRHWYACECGVSEEGADHTNETKSDKNGHWTVCTVCGYGSTKVAHTEVDGACGVCGFKLVSEGLAFEQTEGGYVVMSIGTCNDKELYIPATYNGQPVVAIASHAFAGTDIRAVYLPVWLNEIGTFAFANCTALESINLDNVTLVGSFAFNGCTALKSDVTFSQRGAKVVVQDNAFSGCSAITKVNFSDEFYEIYASAFYGCSSLKEVCFSGPFMVGGFDIHTFAGCTSLKTLKLEGLREDWLVILKDSMGGGFVGEEENLSWYADTGEFVISFGDGGTMSKAELDALYAE